MNLGRLLLAPAALLMFLFPAAGQVDGAGPRAEESSVYFDRAASLFSAGRVEEATESLREALRRRPGWAKAYNGLCVAEATLGSIAEAIRHCRRAASIRPENPDAYYNLGNIYDRLGRHAEAVKAYAKAVEVKPDYAEAYYGMGDAFADLGRESDAVKALEQAVKVKPGFTEALFGLSGMYFKIGRLGEALDAARRTVRLKPDHAEAYANMGMAYAALESYADAADALTRSVKLNPEGRVYQHLGSALYKLGRTEKAAAAYKRATLLEPDNAPARYNLGIVSLKLRLKAEALKQHKKLQSLDEQLARRLYGEIYKDKILDVSRGAGPR